MASSECQSFDIIDQGEDGDFDPKCQIARSNEGEYRSMSDCQSACQQQSVLSSHEKRRIRSASFSELKSGTSASSRNTRFKEELNTILAARRETVITKDHHDGIVHSVGVEFEKEIEIECKFEKRKSQS